MRSTVFMKTRTYTYLAIIFPALFFLLAIGAVLYFRSYIEAHASAELLIATLALLIVAGTHIFYTYLRSRERVFRKVGAGTLPGSEQLYEELFMNSPTPYLLVDKKDNIIATNVAAVRIFGLAENALRSKKLFSLLEAENEAHLALIPQKLEKGIFVNDEEVKITRPDGTKRWASLSAFPVTGTGRQQYNLVSALDITRQKQVDQVKTEFVSLASHQLRTPISSMKWNVELLMSDRVGQLNEKQQAYAEKIERASNRMDALVSDFLNVSKLELGTLVPRAKQIDLTDFLESVYDEFLERIEEKKLTFNKEYDPEITTLVVDKRLLRMVLSNLVSNAVKYTPEGGAVTVRYGGNNKRITFFVIDTGMGIPKEDQERLFTKLFRAGNAREQVPDGTGLGLYVVKQAVEVMNGTISFTSRENEGTTFEVVLPR